MNFILILSLLFIFPLYAATIKSTRTKPNVDGAETDTGDGIGLSEALLGVGLVVGGEKLSNLDIKKEVVNKANAITTDVVTNALASFQPENLTNVPISLNQQVNHAIKHVSAQVTNEAERIINQKTEKVIEKISNYMPTSVSNWLQKDSILLNAQKKEIREHLTDVLPNLESYARVEIEKSLDDALEILTYGRQKIAKNDLEETIRKLGMSGNIAEKHRKISQNSMDEALQAQKTSILEAVKKAFEKNDSIYGTKRKPLSPKEKTMINESIEKILDNLSFEKQKDRLDDLIKEIQEKALKNPKLMDQLLDTKTGAISYLNPNAWDTEKGWSSYLNPNAYFKKDLDIPASSIKNSQKKKASALGQNILSGIQKIKLKKVAEVELNPEKLLDIEQASDVFDDIFQKVNKNDGQLKESIKTFLQRQKKSAEAGLWPDLTSYKSWFWQKLGKTASKELPDTTTKNLDLGEVGEMVLGLVKNKMK